MTPAVENDITGFIQEVVRAVPWCRPHAKCDAVLKNANPDVSHSAFHWLTPIKSMSTVLMSPASGNSGADSFAALFEESLSRQDMRSGEVISAEVVRLDHNFVIVNAGLKSEAFIPIEEFKNDTASWKSMSATSSPLPSSRWKTVSATPSCRVTRPSASHPGCRWKKRWNPARSSPAPSTARSRAA